MSGRRLIASLLCLGAAMLPLAAAGPASAAFVTRDGTHLYLNGRPFVFTGLNDWNANSRSGNQACGYQPNLAQDLANWGSGPEVVRVWFFQMFATTSTGAANLDGIRSHACDRPRQRHEGHRGARGSVGLMRKYLQARDVVPNGLPTHDPAEGPRYVLARGSGRWRALCRK